MSIRPSHDLPVSGPIVPTRASATGNPDRQAFPRELVDQRHQSELATVMGLSLDEVVAPHMVATLRSQPDATRFRSTDARFLQAQPALGACRGKKGRDCVGRNCGYDPISQFETSSQLRLFPKEKPAWRGRHQAGLCLIEAPGDPSFANILPVKYSVPSCFRSRLRHRLKLMSGSVPGV